MTMAGPSDEEQIAYQHFKETLFNELTENSKPVITSLSMLADDYKKFSDSIARSINEYIRQVPPQSKLLGLYLLDSIVKSQKESSDYVQVFQRYVVPLFVLVFESVDEPQRKSMFKLRQTWTNVFSARCLYDIDLKTRSVDPAWPITAKLPASSSTETIKQPPPPPTSTQQKGGQQIESLGKSIAATANSLQHHQNRLSGAAPAHGSLSDTSIKSSQTAHAATTRQSVDLTALGQTTVVKQPVGRPVSPIRDPRLANRPKAPPATDSTVTKTTESEKKQESSVIPPNKSASTTTVIKKKPVVVSTTSGGVSTSATSPKSSSTLPNGGMKRASPTVLSAEQTREKSDATISKKAKLDPAGNKKTSTAMNSESALKQNRAILNKIAKSSKFESETPVNQESSTNANGPIESRQTESPTSQMSSSQTSTRDKSKPDSPPESKTKKKDNIENMKKPLSPTALSVSTGPTSSTTNTVTAPAGKQKKKTLLPSPPIELAVKPPSNGKSKGNGGYIEPNDIDERFVGDVDERFAASSSSTSSGSGQPGDSDHMAKPARRTLIDKPPDLSEIVAGMEQLPPIRPRYEDEEQTSSVLVLDGRSYRVQPDQTTTIKYFYTTCQVLCDTRSRDIFLDEKRVAKMGDPTKEVSLGGRKCRLMYMGRRCELWIDGVAFSFRADAPPKQISLRSQLNPSHIKRYYVTVDGRTMSVFFNNFKVCQIPSASEIADGAAQHVKLGPDEYEKHEVSFVCPPKRIMIDGVERRMRYDTPVPCIEMDHGRLHVIRFDGPPRPIHIDETAYEVPMDKARRIKLNGRAHEIAWGGPGYEVIVDGRPYEIQFNQPAREIMIGTRPHMVYIEGDAPEVKILGRLPPELLSQQQAAQHKEAMRQMESSEQKSSISSLIPTDVNELIKKLTMKNMLPTLPTPAPARQETSSSQQQQQQQSLANTRFRVPDLTSMEPELLKQKYDQAIVSLYSGNQCPQCGNRFNQSGDSSTASSSSQSRYAKHLDWHFRQNKKEKEEVNKVKYRAWFYPITDWILYEEISEEVELQQHQQQMQSQQHQGSNTNNLVDMGDQMLIDSSDLASSNGSSNGEPALPGAGGSTSAMSSSFMRQNSSFNAVKTCAASDDIGDTCAICTDPFEIFWYAEKEEWHFKDAIRVENKLYHPICFEDATSEENINNHGSSSMVLGDEAADLEPQDIDHDDQNEPQAEPMNQEEEIHLNRHDLAQEANSVKAEPV